VRTGNVHTAFNAEVRVITKNAVHYSIKGNQKISHNDSVFAMPGCKPDLALLETIGVNVHIDTGKPDFNQPTMETNIPGIYVAGVVAAGYNNHEIFIENGRIHGAMIAKSNKNKTWR